MNIPLHKNIRSEDELSLVQACKDHDGQAQKRLYYLHADAMMMVCLRYLGNREDAQDTLMNAFVALFQSINSFEYRGAGSLNAWIKGITVNHCLMHLRKQRNAFRLLDDQLEHIAEDYSDQLPLMQLTVKEIMRWIHELPVGYKTVFNLYVFEDMQHKEIAALLDISENTSKSQLYKARNLLQKKIVKFQNAAL